MWPGRVAERVGRYGRIDCRGRRTLHRSPSCFAAITSRAPIDLGRQFDLVQSLEVAEHLPAANAEQFVETLTAHEPSYPVLSGSPGTGWGKPCQRAAARLLARALPRAGLCCVRLSSSAGLRGPGNRSLVPIQHDPLHKGRYRGSSRGADTPKPSARLAGARRLLAGGVPAAQRGRQAASDRCRKPRLDASTRSGQREERRRDGFRP